MIRYVQRDPDNGEIGNCFQCCIAGLLDLPLENVPHFYERLVAGEEVRDNRDFVNWFLNRGLYPIWVPIPAVEPQQLLFSALGRGFPHGVKFILQGQNSRGREHVVVMADGELVHDPSGKHRMLSGPGGRGIYWAMFVGKFV